MSLNSIDRRLGRLLDVRRHEGRLGGAVILDQSGLEGERVETQSDVLALEFGKTTACPEVDRRKGACKLA